MTKRKFFSGNSLRQALVSAASFFDIPPDEVVYREVEKRHGFIKTRRKAVIEVDADDPRRPLPERSAEEAPSRGEPRQASEALEGPPGAPPRYPEVTHEERAQPETGWTGPGDHLRESVEEDLEEEDEDLEDEEYEDEEDEYEEDEYEDDEDDEYDEEEEDGEDEDYDEDGEDEDYDEDDEDEAREEEPEVVAPAAGAARPEGRPRRRRRGRGRGRGGEPRPASEPTRGVPAGAEGPRAGRDEPDRAARGERGAGREERPARTDEGPARIERRARDERPARFEDRAPRGPAAAGGRAGRGGEPRFERPSAPPAAEAREGSREGGRRRRRGRGGRSGGGGGLVELPERPRRPSERYREATGELADATRQVLDRLLDVAGIDVTYTVLQGEERLEVDLSGPDEALLTAESGELLRAFEVLVPRAVRGVAGESVEIRINSGDFHEIHEEQLRSLAQRTASEVRRSERPRTLEPMSPADRRIIHITLADEPGVTSASDGHGHLKRIVVKPA